MYFSYTIYTNHAHSPTQTLSVMPAHQACYVNTTPDRFNMNSSTLATLSCPLVRSNRILQWVEIALGRRRQDRPQTEALSLPDVYRQLSRTIVLAKKVFNCLLNNDKT